MIAPGQRYTTEKVAPWVMTSDDPESPPFPIGEWLTSRWHVDCDPRWY